MLRTERKTDQARQGEKQPGQARREQGRETLSRCAQTLEAILAGGSWEQFPAERLRELSHTLGNAALLELLALKSTGPETVPRPLPGGSCAAAPAEVPVSGGPELVPAPDFSSMSPLGDAPPLTL